MSKCIKACEVDIIDFYTVAQPVELKDISFSRDNFRNVAGWYFTDTHPLRPHDLAVVIVAGRVFEDVALAFVEVVQGKCVPVCSMTCDGSEVCIVAGNC